MCPRDCAAAMSTAPGAEAYFRRSSLFWFTVITLSFGYYTVKAARGVMALIQDPPLQARAGRAGADTAPAGPEPRERGLDPRRRRRVGPPAPFAGAGDPEKPATQAFPVWGGHGSPPDDSVVSRWWWRSRRPARLLPPTSVQPDPCPRWSPSWGWHISR